MALPISEITALLARTPAALDALLRGLPHSFTEQNEGPDTMTAREVIAHLIAAERTNWIPRTRVILEHGDSRDFPAFDRFAYVRASKNTPLAVLLDEFTAARAESLETLRSLNLQSLDLARCGCHPALGSVTLAELLSAWAAHDLTHLHQIARLLARPLAEAVGPFQRFLGVLQCDAHGV